jgi:ATP-dependent protease HslVU (ClpYQ) peptidase subunit
MKTMGWGTAMKIANRKTRKQIRKSVKKVVKKHGPKIVAGLAGGIASTLATLASTEAPRTRGKQSNLRKAARQVSELVTDDEAKKPRKRGAARKRSGSRVKRGEERAEPQI